MKKTVKCLSVLLALMLLASCAAPGQPSQSTQPSTKPQKVYNYDPTRPLPVLPEKFVTHDAENWVIARDGVANATIVYPAGQMKVEFAADDLADYLQRITGAEFTIIDDSQPLGDGNYILVGATAKTLELGEGVYPEFPAGEGYTIRTQDNFLILCGNDSGVFEGSQFAVTRLLEEAGCGWFTMDASWQPVPKTANLSVKPVDKDFAPRFDSRNLGVNMNLSLRWYGGGYQSYNGHALPSLAHPNTYYDTNPEYYALVNGSRKPDLSKYWQFCYTNEGLAQKVAEGVIRFFDSHPGYISYSITANDGWDQYWCECDVCAAAGNHSDQMVIFGNRVAEAVSKVHPDRKLSILAYHSTYLPPENTYDCHPNLEIKFCIETAPFEDLSKGEMIYDGYNSTNRVTYTQSWKDNCQTYIQKTNAKLTAIWSWYCIAGGRQDWVNYPWVQGNTISNNLELWEEMGVEEVYIDSEGLYNVRWPLYYAAGRCMWNEGLTAEQVLYDACLKLYGAAADEMFLYYRHLADAAAQYGAVDSSITWVPPDVYTVYGISAPLIHSAITAAREKSGELTQQQAKRIQNQYDFWVKTYQHIL